MYIATTEKGLCYVGSQNQSFDELSQWVKKYLPYHNLVQDNEKLQSYATELIEYLQGGRQVFSLPVDLHGTSFQLAVWDALSKIPYGKTSPIQILRNILRNLMQYVQLEQPSARTQL